ncbi:polyprenyl diphosphate synthase [Limnohabitans sp.]|uniref:polyprenyl diphosphate synthase n=1 Tax=Limnohabitans sp. TaxID=1907725 RepID=UPI00286EFADE|nr:polyprenyl diphosphate synthase [Limnohabitans sp.]
MTVQNQATATPQHIAIIMDGNGRWAQKRHMPRTVGHAKGAAGVKALLQHCAKLGVKYLTLFAFSTENWGRPAEEVSTLMGLFFQYLEKEMSALANAGVRLKVIGDVAGFPPELQTRIHAAEAATQHNQAITLCVAANYGGQWDMVQAVKNWHAANPTLSANHLTPDQLAQHLSTAGMPDVDLLIRTGGEQRISNFLLWQAAYAELYFTDSLWPEFDEAELNKALHWYATRERRFGLVQTQKLKETA